MTEQTASRIYAVLKAEAPQRSPAAALRTDQPGTAAGEADGIGLALSGGGIRSATFSLGVLQALASKDRLTSFDYLSTVSGGGYIGSWLSAWR